MSFVMPCPRCHGLLVREFLPHAVTGEVAWHPMWACVNCGEKCDATILKHRRINAYVARTFPRLWTPLPTNSPTA